MAESLSANNLTEQQIREWFAVHGGGGLILPSGWFGRPYDNIHRLTDLRVENTEMTVELDSRLELKFKGSLSIEVINNELKISEFEVLSFRWAEFGSGKVNCQSFASGVVVLSA